MDGAAEVIHRELRSNGKSWNGIDSGAWTV
jgi:hypothetical protein